MWRPCKLGDFTGGQLFGDRESRGIGRLLNWHFGFGEFVDTQMKNLPDIFAAVSIRVNFG
jgi:hypothetical protein